MIDYKTEIHNTIDNIIKKFIEDISNKFSIDKEKLNDLWESNNKVEKEDNTKEKDNEKFQRLKSLKKKELEEMCRQKNLSDKGKKDELVSRLISNVNKSDNVINTILTGLSSITITKNKFGNYEHIPTKFIFNKTTKIVIGKQEGDKIISLSESDIEICNQYKFKYNLPENLNDQETDGGDAVDKQLEEDDVFDDEEDEEEEED